jgi:hypothetical protein
MSSSHEKKELYMQHRNNTLARRSLHLRSLRRFLFIGVTMLSLLAIAFLGQRSTTFADNLHTAAAAAPANTAVTTYHNDNLRTGQNLNETTLTTSNVTSSQFGKRVTYPVDGQIYTQPLFLPNVTINGSAHNVVYVATENDSVYAFDADQTTAVAPLWKTSFLTSSSVTAVPAGDVFTRYANHDIDPIIGITSTPVIDTSTNTLYVVAMTKENGSQYVQRLHAIDVTTGLEKPGSPIVIQASISGTGYDSSGGRITFNPKTENQRTALLLVNGVVYISWASFGDTDPYHGWLIGYNYTNAALHQVSVYNDSANGNEGGVWMSGAGPAADSSGNIYLITGNGTFDLNTGGPDSGDTFLKLGQNGQSVTDYFTPFNQSCLSASDADLGSGGGMLLPDQTNTAHPHLMIGAGKEGRIYVVDRDNMGHFTQASNLNCGSVNQTTIDKVVQETSPGTLGNVFSTPGYWASSSSAWVYMSGIDDTMKAYQISNDTLSSSPTSRTPESFSFPGVTPSISSNGNTSGTGIVWTIAPPNACSSNGCNPGGPGTLRAYDATNLGNELYNSGQNSSRDQLDSYTKFSVPTIANGKVLVGTQTSLSIFGLLNTSPTPTPTPVTPTPTPRPTITPTVTPTTTPTPTPTPITSGSACKISYVVQNQWPGGFTNNTTITNTGTAPISSWTLKFTFPGTQGISQIWNASASLQGEQVTVQNLSYNGSIPAGGSTTFGFNGSWSGSNPTPTTFTLNGTTCSTS